VPDQARAGISALPLSFRLVYASAPGLTPGASAPASHALYEAGEFCLDLRLSREGLPHRMVLVGQVADTSAPGMPVEPFPVSLESAAGQVARDVCNRFGEFCLEYAGGGHLQLRVAVGPRGVIALPLPGAPAELESWGPGSLRSESETQHRKEMP